MWDLRALMQCANTTQTEVDGRWVPARPIPLPGIDGLLCRIADAWEVLMGRSEAFKWPEGQ